MTILENHDYIVKVLYLINKWDINHDLIWEVDKDNSLVYFSIMCSDVFYWGCADAEKITLENIDMLDIAMQDAKNACPDISFDGTILWCARVRKMRPQGATYEHIEKSLWPLLNECGPVRKCSLGNPKDIPEE